MATTIEQATCDLKIADQYVDNFERRIGKKASAGLRKMLKDAVMAGICHGRETSSTSESDELNELLKRMQGAKGFLR